MDERMRKQLDFILEIDQEKNGILSEKYRSDAAVLLTLPLLFLMPFLP